MDNQSVDTAAIQERIAELFEQYCAAQVAKDTTTLDKLVGDDYVHFHGSGRIDDKASFLADKKTNRVSQLKRVNSNVHVRVYGATTAVLTARGQNTIVRGDDPKQIVNNGLFTTVWVRPSTDSSNWQIVSCGSGPAPAA